MVPKRESHRNNRKYQPAFTSAKGWDRWGGNHNRSTQAAANNRSFQDAEYPLYRRRLSR